MSKVCEKVQEQGKFACAQNQVLPRPQCRWLRLKKMMSTYDDDMKNGTFENTKWEIYAFERDDDDDAFKAYYEV